MTRTQTLVALAAVFVLGCVTAPVVQRLITPPAYAQPARVQKWQQFCTFRHAANVPSMTVLFDPVNQDIKSHGDEGWELSGGVANDGYTLSYCFKRPAS